MPAYSKGKIYKLYNTITDDIYVGSTTQLLCQRMKGHRDASRNPKKQQMKLYSHINTHGLQHFFIELIENCSCSSKEELSAREGHYIRELKPCLNSQIQGRTQKQYKQENKDVLKEKWKQYYEANREKIQKKRDDYKEQRKIYMKDNEERFREYRRMYRQNNKEIINEKRREYRRKKKQEEN